MIALLSDSYLNSLLLHKVKPFILSCCLIEEITINYFKLFKRPNYHLTLIQINYQLPQAFPCFSKLKSQA